MLTFFTYLLVFIFALMIMRVLHKITNFIEIIYRAQNENKKQLDDRITDLRDHVRRTETAIFKAIDDKTHHMSDPVFRAKLSALEEEIKHNNSLILKMVVLTEKPKPKKAKA